jgi:hypothetical protein
MVLDAACFACGAFGSLRKNTACVGQRLTGARAVTMSRKAQGYMLAHQAALVWIREHAPEARYREVKARYKR